MSAPASQPASVDLDAVVSAATDAIVIADDSGLVLGWNAAATRIFGYAADEMIGSPLSMLMPERFRAPHDAGLARVARTGETRVIGRTVELAGLRSDGTEFPIELSLSTWVRDDRRFFGGIIRDISERKRAEEALGTAHAALAEKTQQLEALSAKLAKYLSRQLYQSIFEGRTDVRVASYRKKLTVFFSDIQGFTELTDSMEAEPLTHLLNEYLGEMSAIATESGGTIDKFIGDGIMIFFGDPETRGEQADAIACVEMALAMRRRVHALQDAWRGRGLRRTLHVRMGINTGYVTVGNFGSEDRLDYTIVGGQVNAAARLEASAAPDEILVSGETYALVREHVRCAPAGEIKVKGIAYPIAAYRVLGCADEAPAVAGAIADEGQGFRLFVDPALMAREDVARAREALGRALRALP